MIQSDADKVIAPEEDLCPNLVLLLAGSCAIALVSTAYLPWPIAIASTALGALMIAGADVDARTYLLPDSITWGTIACGIIAGALDPVDPGLSVGMAIARAAGTALTLALMRWCYASLRGREGLGFGDIKLAAGVGAWLPLEFVPFCFGLAAAGALVAVISGHLGGQVIDRTTKVPFGAFLCPALWLVYYASVLTR